MSAAPSRRHYREYGRRITDVELVAPNGRDTIVVEIREGGLSFVHDSRDDVARVTDDPESEVERLKAAGYQEIQ